MNTSAKVIQAWCPKAPITYSLKPDVKRIVSLTVSRRQLYLVIVVSLLILGPALLSISVREITEDYSVTRDLVAGVETPMLSFKLEQASRVSIVLYASSTTDGYITLKVVDVDGKVVVANVSRKLPIVTVGNFTRFVFLLPIVIHLNPSNYTITCLASEGMGMVRATVKVISIFKLP